MQAAAGTDGEEHDDLYSLRFDGVKRLYGDGAPDRLRHSRVVVVGLGGVGSWAVEALARSGVGSLVLVDLDEICISNTNRQIHALEDTVGRSKAQELRRRVATINPECEVVVREQWVFAVDAADILAEEAPSNASMVAEVQTARPRGCKPGAGAAAVYCA